MHGRTALVRTTINPPFPTSYTAGSVHVGFSEGGGGGSSSQTNLSLHANQNIKPFFTPTVSISGFSGGGQLTTRWLNPDNNP